MLKGINVPERVLYTYLQGNWKMEPKGTIPKEQRFVKDDVAVFYQTKDLRRRLIISYGGHFMPFDTETTVPEFKVIINRLKA